MFGVLDKDDPVLIKESTAYYLRLLMRDEDWELDAVDVVDGQNTRHHSAQKFGVNLWRGGGTTLKDVDHRGRLKSRDRQSDTYAETIIPFVDPKVEKSLPLAVPSRTLFARTTASATRGSWTTLSPTWSVAGFRARCVSSLAALYFGRCERRQMARSATVCHRVSALK